MNSDSLAAIQQRSLHLARRQFLGQCGVGLGRIALAGLLSSAAIGRTAAADVSTLDRRAPHFAGRAKAVIHLFMAGAPSQLEMFVNKPLLTKLEGQPLPPSVYGDQRYAFIRADAAVLGPRFQFARHGASGLELSEAVPHLAGIADDICLLTAVHTDQFNHAPAQIFFNTGFSQPGRPCMGSWVTYGLGAETENLPAFVVMSTGSGLSGGASLWSSGFLPTQFTGVRFRSQGDPILDVSNPEGIDNQVQKETFDVIAKLNQRQLDLVGDPEIATRMSAFEMAARLQVSAPELMDFSDETQETLDLYGCNPSEPSFARACLLARRMVERGVRFVNLFHEGWDAHSNVEGNVRNNCKTTDQASAALVTDLKRRGLLDETLVVWGGEFGRTPMVESNPALGRKQGRDHHPQAYAMWLAGGGIRPGMTYGASDDFGFHPVDQDVHVQDLQATILHCLGLNHEQLTFRRQGLDFRLTGVEPRRVVTEILDGATT